MEKILDENYLDLIIDNTLVDTYDTGNNITPLTRNHAILHVISGRGEPCDLGNYPYHSFSALFTLMSLVGIEQTGVISVQNNPYLSLYGNGVLVGIIDTGIDYQHPAFKYRDGSSRIVSIWDQTIEGGNIPEGFKFGSEYNKELINVALRNRTPLEIVPTVDANGHGTAIASIIAGSENQENAFRGIVTESELVVVKLKEAKRNLRRVSFVPEDVPCYQATDILFAIRYLFAVARKLQRPLAICLALGSSQGSHDGHGTLSEYISDLVLVTGMGVAVAAGNEGNNRRHYYGNINASPYNRYFELNVGENDNMFAMEIWAHTPAHLSIELTSPTGESTNFYYPEINSCNSYNFVLETSRVWINNYVLEIETGDQLILLRFEDPQAGIWRIQVNNLEETAFIFNAWLPAGDFLTDDTYFLEPSPNTTITEPGNAANPLTVSGYDPLTKRIMVDSGRGYTSDNRVKPDVAAPGLNITCAYPGNRYGEISGTGGAAAFATGAIAMLLEWGIVKGNYTSITGNNVNKLIMRGAVRDQLVYTYPNNIWGYGQLDIYNVFRKLSL